MATKSITKSTKPTTVKPIEDKVIAEKVVEKKVTKQKKEFNDHDSIPCHSVTVGGLSIVCQSGAYYEFREYGSDSEIEYRDLVWLVRKHSDHVFLPRFIIDDEDFINEFPQLKQLYADMYSMGDLKEILRLPLSQMEKEISKLPEELLSTIRSLAATMVSTGEIDSVRTIRKLTDIFGADFNLLSELFSN